VSTAVRRDIQGLRALAVMVVVLYHFKISVIHGGFIGVDVFFVISGFVITSALRREWATNGSVSLTAFYARRARRILPAATVVALGTLAVSLWWFGRNGSVSLLSDVRATALFVANFHFAGLHTGYFTANAAKDDPAHTSSTRRTVGNMCVGRCGNS
jgi:peptidoglycan/LPS O-acetylase OafA/YrhL